MSWDYMFFCALISPFYLWKKNAVCYLKIHLEFIDDKWIQIGRKLTEIYCTNKDVEQCFKRYLRKADVFHHLSLQIYSRPSTKTKSGKNVQWLNLQLKKCFSCLVAEGMIENLTVYSAALKTNSQHLKVNISTCYIIFYY